MAWQQIQITCLSTPKAKAACLSGLALPLLPGSRYDSNNESSCPLRTHTHTRTPAVCHAQLFRIAYSTLTVAVTCRNRGERCDQVAQLPARACDLTAPTTGSLGWTQQPKGSCGTIQASHTMSHDSGIVRKAYTACAGWSYLRGANLNGGRGLLGCSTSHSHVCRQQW